MDRQLPLLKMSKSQSEAELPADSEHFPISCSNNARPKVANTLAITQFTVHPERYYHCVGYLLWLWAPA